MTLPEPATTVELYLKAIHDELVAFRQGQTKGAEEAPPVSPEAITDVKEPVYKPNQAGGGKKSKPTSWK